MLFREAGDPVFRGIGLLYKHSFFIIFKFLQLLATTLEGCGRSGGTGRRFVVGLSHVARHEYLCPVAGDFQSWAGLTDY